MVALTVVYMYIEPMCEVFIDVIGLEMWFRQRESWRLLPPLLFITPCPHSTLLLHTVRQSYKDYNGSIMSVHLSRHTNVHVRLVIPHRQLAESPDPLHRLSPSDRTLEQIWPAWKCPTQKAPRRPCWQKYRWANESAPSVATETNTVTSCTVENKQYL